MLSYKSLINEGRLYRAVRSRIIKHNDKSVSRDRAVGSSWLLRSTSESEYNPESRSDRKVARKLKSQYRGIEQSVFRGSYEARAKASITRNREAIGKSQES